MVDSYTYIKNIVKIAIFMSTNIMSFCSFKSKIILIQNFISNFIKKKRLRFHCSKMVRNNSMYILHPFKYKENESLKIC